MVLLYTAHALGNSAGDRKLLLGGHFLGSVAWGLGRLAMLIMYLGDANGFDLVKCFSSCTGVAYQYWRALVHWYKALLGSTF